MYIFGMNSMASWTHLNFLLSYSSIWSAYLMHITTMATIIAIPISPNTTANTILVVSGRPTTSSSFCCTTADVLRDPGVMVNSSPLILRLLLSCSKNFWRLLIASSVVSAFSSAGANVNSTSTLPVEYDLSDLLAGFGYIQMQLTLDFVFQAFIVNIMPLSQKLLLWNTCIDILY